MCKWNMSGWRLRLNTYNLQLGVNDHSLNWHIHVISQSNRQELSSKSPNVLHLKSRLSTKFTPCGAQMAS